MAQASPRHTPPLKALSILYQSIRAGARNRNAASRVLPPMQERETQLLSADPFGISEASRRLALGGLVSFPTETVYGLGADARIGTAVADIFAAKDRPQFNPLIVHVANTALARKYAVFDDIADRLARAFWPGPLTLVLPLAPNHGLSELVTAGLPTIGLRVPDHPVAQDLLKSLGGPIAAPSANPSGRISPTTAQHVLSGLSGRIDAVVDGGACPVGLESTIVGFGPIGPILLRPGGLPVDVIEAELGGALPERSEGDLITAPGQLSSHYAPTSTLRLDAQTASDAESFLGFGALDGDVTLSQTGDLREAAARLFSSLHQLDALGRPIAVAPIPNTGLGRAINDRLRRAAAPKPEQNAV